MPQYTYPPAPVVVETTGELAVGATGVLRAVVDGDPVPIYDLNDSPLLSVLVGPKGAHQSFKADIPHGVLDFGSVLLPSLSTELHMAALTAVDVAASALSQVQTLQTSTASAIHTHAAADITDFATAVQAVPGVGGGSVGFVDGGTATSTFSDTVIDGGTA